MASLARLAAATPGDEQVTAALGLLYWHRYELRGAQGDLDDAVRMLSPHFLPHRMYLIPDGLRTEIADAYSTHVDTQIAQILAAGGDVGGNLEGLTAWCRFLLEYADPGNDQYGVHLGGLGTVLYARYDVTGDVGSLLQAIGLLSRAARVTCSGHPSRPGIRGNLAIALARRHGITKSSGDLRTAFEACVAALREPLRPADRDGLMGMFTSLLGERVVRAQAEHRWDDVLAAGRAALDFPESRSYGRQAVAEALEGRFEKGADRADLDEAIRQWTALVREMPDTYTATQRAYLLMKRAFASWRRYQEDHRPEDLDAVIDAQEQALALLPGDDVTLRWELLRRLAISLLERIEHKATRDDVERAVSVIRAGLADRDGHRAPPHLLAVLTRALPRALWFRYVHARRPEDLDEAAGLLDSDAVREVSSADHVMLFGALTAQVQRARYREGRGLDALHASVAAARESLGAAADTDPGRPGVLVQLGMSLFYLYQHVGDLATLDEAVDHAREAVRLLGDEALDGQAGLDALYVLGTSLAERGADTGSLDDLDTAVRTLRRLHASPEAVSTREFHGLGFALTQRFDRCGDPADLNEAVGLLRRAAESCEFEKAIVLSGLSSALLLRYRHGGDGSDLDEALATARRAADEVAAHDPGSVPTLSSLVAALIDEQQRHPERVDADELVTLCRRVVDLAPPDHAALGLFHHNLGIAQKVQADATEPDEIFRMLSELRGRTVVPFGVVEAVAGLTKAAHSEVLAATQRIRSAWAAALTLYPLDMVSALDLLEHAVELIPLVAPRRIARADQQHAVKDLSALVTFTAAASLDAGEQRHPEARYLPLRPYAARSALQTLEQGRAVLLSQMLDTRGDISDLRRHHADHADRFLRLRDLLDGEGDGPVDRARAAAELTATIEEIRGFEGFASFARQPEPEALLAAAEAGPIVVFNCDETRCDALLVTGGGVRHLALPRLTHAELTSRADLFHRTLAVVADPRTGWRAQREAQRTLSGILGWLWDVAVEPVLLALDIGPGSGQDGEPPRVWWSPGGLLGSLPLHAAGHHADSAGGGDRTVLDRVVSSYTPTIRALRHARRPRPAGGGPGRSLVVAMPSTPGAPPLAGASEEAAAVAALLPEPTTVVAGPPTRAAVLAGLADARVIHLACHAVTDAGDPSRSRLLLWDHRTSALTVAGVASVALERAELAYLSACRTTYTAASDLLDEAIHLTSAFQLAGFRHVVGTLWEVDDMISARVAKGFYMSLSAAGGLDCARSAAALRTSVLALRDEYPATPSLWAGYLHAGA
ncbi:CHAT domain-containing protein [Streptomyces sp. WAC05374]|nr:CHAT domain-containing protein [Streptomyces sp. WAC05374]TDF40205.1 CHAT domain-containing protein [Streptomyces sp. WAC05374]TDF53395.1 CHAT domain-containing protein [Streptomyces sp. WAC05374]TDF59242.1 CHAT domain-containing protein [Streptomyces sp. WAC05374]